MNMVQTDNPLLEDALKAIEQAHAAESDRIRIWASDLMTHSVTAFQARIPRKYRTASLADLPLGTAKRIREWLIHPQKQTLFLVGPTGKGKTHAAWATCTQALVDYVIASSKGAILEPPTAGVRTVSDLLDEFRGEGSLPTGWNYMRATPLLGLDDLGAARATPWALERMLSLVNARTNDCLKQIVTTNADWDLLVDTWGEPLMDRLREHSLTIEMLGPSRRAASADA